MIEPHLVVMQTPDATLSMKVVLPVHEDPEK